MGGRKLVTQKRKGKDNRMNHMYSQVMEVWKGTENLGNIVRSVGTRRLGSRVTEKQPRGCYAKVALCTTVRRPSGLDVINQCFSKCDLKSPYQIQLRICSNVDFQPLHLEWRPRSMFSTSPQEELFIIKRASKGLSKGIAWSDLYFRNILPDQANSCEEHKFITVKGASTCHQNHLGTLSCSASPKTYCIWISVEGPGSRLGRTIGNCHLSR